jgi:nitrate/nitrite transporter NarK
MGLPHLLKSIGPHRILVAAWILAIVGVVLLALMKDGRDYWRFCFPGIVIYILGVGSVYFVSMISVVGSAQPQDQGAVAGIYNVSKPIKLYHLILIHTRCD